MNVFEFNAKMEIEMKKEFPFYRFVQKTAALRDIKYVNKH